MKTVAIVAAHFVPSNLAAVHRARLWSLHLREFGWEPVIVTTHWHHYEETPEMELLELLPADLKVIRTKAFGTKPVRLVGDIGIRAFRWHYRALCELAQRREMDFLHITIPSNFSACLGRLVHKRCGTPYGIDYIDPWVHQFPGSDRPFTKAWGSARLAERLEPWAVRKASLITGINRRYYEGMLQRNPGVRKRAVLTEMPYGGSESDHEYVRQHPRPARLFEQHKGKFNLIYAGAMLPKAYPVLALLLEALVLLRQKYPRLAEVFHLHFVGTGKSSNDPTGFNIRPRIEHFGLLEIASEYPQRLPYLDVLGHLHSASGILVLGSTEPHYSPSKIFQSVMSRRPVFAILHEQSTAVPLLRATNAAEVLTLNEGSLPETGTLTSALEKFVYSNGYSEDRADWDVLKRHSALESARLLANGLGEALTQSRRGIPDPSFHPRLSNAIGYYSFFVKSPPALKRAASRVLEVRLVSWIFERAWMLKSRRRLPVVSAAPVRPPELTIEVTNICNANCVFCGYQFQERVKGVMPFDLFKLIIDQYVAIGGGMIELTPVVGDALVDKNLERKIHYARSHPQIHRASFITNAILLTRARFETLVEAGVTHIGISISGLDKDEYERVYRVSRFETVIRNLTEIASSPAFAKVQFIIGIRSDRPLAWRRDPALQQLRSIGYTKCTNTSLFDSWSGRIRNEDLPGGMFVRPSRRKTTPCWQLYNSTTVMADGRMTACGCRDLNGTSELSLGNIRDQTLDAPWKDGRMEALRQRFRDGNLPDICRDCQHYTPVRETHVGFAKI